MVNNPMQKLSMHASPRCGAQTRQQTPCRAPSMKNGRCRMHGGKSSGAPTGKANGNYKTGYWTKEAVENREHIRVLVADSDELLRRIE